MKKIDEQKEIKAYTKKCTFRNITCKPIQKVDGMTLKSHCEQCYKFTYPNPLYGRSLYNNEEIAVLKEMVEEYKRELAENCKFARKKNDTCGFKDCFDMCSFCDREFSR
ncbi:hypothetical protein HDR59_05080 [bacterium]|nr:hypothetical protein [bacterium]